MEIRSGFAAGWKMGGGRATASDANARWMLFTGTTGTLTRINRVHCAGVPVVPVVPAGGNDSLESLPAQSMPLRISLPYQAGFGEYIIFMVDSSHPLRPKVPCRTLGFSHFRSATHRKSPAMMKVTAKPAWQWSSNTAPASSRLPTGFTRTPSLLPRSLDVSFCLRYRR